MTADPKRVSDVRKKLDSFGQGKRIGISWHTSNAQSGSVRNIPLCEWLPILSPLPDVISFRCKRTCHYRT